MSMINYASREINCKIVYYGSGLGGKTTNLEHVYGKVTPDTRGKLISLATETERTLFFDFRSEEHTSELQSHHDLVCRLLLEKKKKLESNNLIKLRLLTYTDSNAHAIHKTTLETS